MAGGLQGRHNNICPMYNKGEKVKTSSKKDDG